MRHQLSRLSMALAIVVSLLVVQAGQALATAPASAPTILGPANGSNVGNVNPTLSWSPVQDANRYRVQISTSNLFTTAIYSVDTYALQATPPSLLPFTTLYWRVAAEDAGGLTGPYAVASFTKVVSAAPVALTPTNGQILTFPTDPVVFSWQPVPGAISYTLQVGTSSDLIGAAQYTTANTSFTLTDTQSFTLSDGVTLEPWWWQVQAVYPNSSVTAWSTPRSYQINWPATPQLETPANGAVSIVDTVFSWDPIPGAASYSIQVSPNGDWQNNKIIDQTGVLSTRYAPDITLLNTSYYWRVRARAAGNATNYGQWSDAFLFTRSWSPIPVLITPAWDPAHPSVIPTVPNLEFSWTPVAASGAGWVDHASHYQIQISDDQNFNSNVLSCYTDQTTFTPYVPVISTGEPGGCGIGASLNIGSVYYWRVRGIDAPGNVLGLWDSNSSANTHRFIYAPPMPSIISTSPCTASGTHTQTPVLCWSAVSGAETYTVTILKFSGAQADAIETRALSYTPLVALNPTDGPFSWNVETKDAQGKYGIIRGTWPTFTLDPLTTTDLTHALLSPADDSHSLRMPTFAWQPVTGATYYRVWYADSLSFWSATPLSGAAHLPFAAFTYADVPLATGEHWWKVEAFNASDASLGQSATRSFWVGTTSDTVGDWVIPWDHYLTPECTVRSDPQVSRCTPTLGQTQELSWTPEPNASAYFVYVSRDVNFTNIYSVYETNQTTLTPRESWLDSQAGESYYWFVQPCALWQKSNCGPAPDSIYGQNDSSTYRKSSPSVKSLTTTTSANPPVVATTIPYQVTLNWADYMTTSQDTTYPATGAVSSRVTQEAMKYKVEVSTSADFGNIIDTRYVDQIQYTPWVMTYPEGQLFWRVQGLDGSNNPLTMSLTGSVTKATPAITLTSPANTGTVSGVPFFTWVPQNWAARYTIEIYKNGDTFFSPPNLLFSQTTPISAWSPTATMPAGVYAWRVRRLDAGDRPGPWSAGRTFTLHPAAPTLNTPADLAKFDGSNLPFSWLPVQGAVSYQFQSSTLSDFSSLFENVTTVMTAWSPVVMYPAGVYYWRVNVLDASGNVLSTSSSRSFTSGTGPDAPTGAAATAGNTTATVSWTAPASTGTGPITGYIVTSDHDSKTCTTTGATHCTVGGLTNGNSYTFAVQAITDYGTGPASPYSNAVVPSSISVLAVTAGSSQTSSVAFNVTVTCQDGVGVTQNGYRGAVHFTSSDPAAILPADYTFTVSDNGVHVFSVTLRTSGSRSITVTDMVTATLTGTKTVSVAPGPATRFTVSTANPWAAGAAHTVTISAKDAFGNTATGYTGTVHLTSTDTQAVLPANYTFLASDHGVHGLIITLKTIGSRTVTATDTVTASITGSQTVTVNPGAAKSFTVVTVTPWVAGVSHTVTITAKDSYGNTVTGYVGTIHLTSTDTQAVLPANYTFVSGDAGVHRLVVTLKTAGSRTVTATDTVTSTIKGTSSAITVTPTVAKTFTLTGAVPWLAGASH